MSATSSAKETPLPAVAGAKAAEPLLHFAIELESYTSSNKPINLSDLEHYTLRANDPSKFPVGGLAQDTAHQLESVGRRLWNIFLRKQNCSLETNNESPQSKVYLRARLFGYLLLGIGWRGRPGANANQSASYLTRLGLALSKACINQSNLESARTALQKVTEYLPSAACGTAPAEGDGPASSHADYASYYILRIVLSWKEDRLDLAEHMYSKATQHTPYIDIGTRATLIRLLMQIGKSFISKSNVSAAVHWFRRASAESFVSMQERNTMSSEDLLMHQQTRLTALSNFVQSLTGLRSHDSLEEANRVVTLAQEEFGERRVEVLEMLVMVQTANGGGDALTELLEVLLP